MRQVIVCPLCDVPMKVEIGKDVDEPLRWLWYRCSWNPRHISAALPLPRNLP